MNNYAISTADLASSLTKSSASLVAAGGDLAEAAALTATANAIIQDADSVGTALKTTSLRLRGTDAKVLEEEGLDSEGAVTSKSKLQSKVKALSGVDILTQSGEYKSTYEILSQIAEVWEDISDIDQAALLELISGKRNSSVVAAILQSPEELKAAYEDAQNAEGSALKENEKYMDSIQGRIDQFNNAVQTLWTNILDDDVVKTVVNWGTNIVKSLDTVQGKISAIIKIIAILMAYKKVNPLDWIQKISTFFTQFNGKNLKESVAILGQYLLKLVGIAPAMKTMTAETVANTLATITNDNAKTKEIMTTMGLTSSTQMLTQAEREQAITKLINSQSTNKLTNEQIMQMAAQWGVKVAYDATTGSLKVLDTATKSFMATNPVGWILLIASAIMGVVTWMSSWRSTTEKLSDELSDLKSELGNIKSELDSVNSELETTHDRMAELLAMESLSFVEQEELAKLRQANAELERRKKILTLEEERTQKRTAEKAQETVDSKMDDTSWDGDWKSMTSSIGWNALAYMGTGAAIGATIGAAGGPLAPLTSSAGAILGGIAGIITGIVTGIANELTTNRISTEDKLNREIEEYDDLIKQRDDIQDKLLTADQTKGKFLWWETDSEYDKLKKDLDKIEDEISETEAYIDTTLSEIGSELEGVEYGQGADDALDVYSQFKNRWEIAYGSDGAKATAIEGIMSKDKFEDLSQQIGVYTQKLKEGDKSAAESIKSLIENSEEFVDELAANGLELQDAIDYFTLEKGIFDSDTVKGVALQYEKGKKVMQQFAEAAKESRKELGDAALTDEEYQQMLKYQSGGNVDLFNRPTIDPDLLVKSGWSDAIGSEDMATVFTQTYQNQAGTVYANFTPILPNGKILTPDQLTIYAEEVCEGVREDDLNLRIGSEFDTKQAATDAAENIHKLQEKYYKDPITSEISFEVDGKTKKVNFDDLFEEGEDGQFTAKKEEFSEMLKGMDEDARTTFISLAEKVKNGALTWNQAMDAMSAKGLVESLEVMNSQISSINSEMFSDVAGELSGLVDTFGELSKVLESTASSMELVHTAQTQMNNSGRISVKTALELMQSTNNWNEILEIENGNIRLATDAEQKLIGAKLDHIKVNLQNALATVEAQIAAVEATGTSVDFATTLDESTNIAVQELSKSMITLVELMKAYKDGTSTEDAMARADEQIAKLDERLNTYKGPKLTKSEALSNLNQQKENIQAMLSMYEGIDTPSEFKNNYDYDKTPGDKYDSGDAESILEALQNYYERQISELDNQITQLENKVEILEAENEGVSKQYYEEQINREEKKLDLYEQQLGALKDLQANTPEGSDEWWEISDAIWEVEHAMQETTLRMIEGRKAIVELYETAFDRVAEAYDNKTQLKDDQLASLQNYAELLEMDGITPTASLFEEQKTRISERMANNQSKLSSTNAIIEALKAEQSKYEVGSADWNRYDELLVTKRAEQRQIKLDLQTDKKDLKQIEKDFEDALISAWDAVMDVFNNKNAFFEGQQGFIDSYISRLETLNINVPDEAYEKQIEVQEKINKNNEAALARGNSELKTIGKQFGKDSTEYLEKQKELGELERTVYEGETKRLELQKQIIDNQFDRFNQILDRINDSISELDRISGLISDEDVATEDGTWTAEGLTRAGFEYEKMAYSKNNIEKINAELAHYDELLEDGAISEKEHYEKTQELNDQLWSNIEAYKASEDAIIDLAEARIDAIENGLKEEVDAYAELIELKKEELDAERDLFEFRRDVEDQSKNIAEIERRMASISASSSDEDRAEYKRLEKELYEANRGLDDTYRSHAYDSTSQALDEELDAFEKNTEDYIRNLRDEIENTDELIKRVYADVVSNGQLVLETMVQLSDEYGFTLNENLTAPWVNADGKSLEFEQHATQHYNNVKTAVNTGTQGFIDDITQPWKDGTSAANTFSTESQGLYDLVIDKAKDNQDNLSDYLSKPWETAGDAIDQTVSDASSAIDRLIREAEEAAREIEKNLNIETSDYSTKQTYNSGEGGGDGGGYVPQPSPGPGNTETKLQKAIKDAQAYVDKKGFSEGDKARWGQDAGFKPLLQALHAAGGSVNDLKGKVYTNKTSGKIPNGYSVSGINLLSLGADDITVTLGGKTYKAALSLPNNGNTIDYQINKDFGGKTPSNGKLAMLNGVLYVSRSNHWYKVGSKNDGNALTSAARNKLNGYAKGTTGTPYDQWAITDEYGPELTLIPGKNGNLSFMRAGTGVVPADLTKRIMEIAQMPASELGNNIVKAVVPNIETANQAVQVNFEALVKTDYISKDILPEVEDMVSKQLNNFTKQLNYSLKKVGGR